MNHLRSLFSRYMEEEGGEPKGGGDPAGDPAGDPKGGDPAGDPKGEENWRAVFGEDEKLQKQLDRYMTPADLGKAFLEQKATISQRFASSKLPDDATDEQIANWRELNGIPSEAKGYLEGLDKEFGLDETDIEYLGDLAERFHGMNLPPEAVKASAEWLKSIDEAQKEAYTISDTNDQQQAVKVLQESWGNDYQANMNVAVSLLQTHLDDESRESFSNARMPDGTAIMNHPAVLNMLASMGREINPIAAIPNAGVNSMDTLQEEKARIEKVMRENRKAYNSDEKMQETYRKIITAEQAMKQKTGG